MKLIARKKRSTCKTCLWWWDLYDTGEWICYNRDSRFFHQLTKCGCKDHEDRVCYRVKKLEKKED